MKIFKRNAVIIAVLLFVAVAVYLNWSYGKNDADGELEVGAASAEPTEASPEPETDGLDAGLYYAEGETADETAGYFDEARLARGKARDEAKTALVTVTETEGASQETIDDALSRITRMAEWTVLESEIEAIIASKGFDDCVVYISDSGVTVTVAPPTVEGLSTAAAARITDVVTEKTAFSAQELNIVEIK